MSDKILSRREFLRASVLATAGAVIASCAPAPTATPVPPTAVPAKPTDVPKPAATAVPPAPTAVPPTARPVTTIDWWTVAGADVGNQADQQALAAAFQKSEAGAWVTVKQTFLPDDGFSEKMNTVLGTGSGVPDVTTFWDAGWFPQATDLREYIARDKVDIAQYSKVHFDSRCRFGDKIIGMPIGVGATIYYYNTTLLAEKGIKTPEWGYTLQQFLDDAVKITNREKKIFGATMQTRIWRAEMFAFGARPFSEDGKTVAGYMNGPKAIKAFEFFYDLAQSGAVPTPAEFQVLQTGGTGPLDLFNTGRLGFAPLNNGQFQIVDKAGVKFGLIHNPTVAGEEIITNGWTLQIGIPNASKNKDAAWEYLKWFTGEPGQKFLMNLGHDFTPTIPALWASHPASKDARFQFFSKILQTRQVWEFSGRFPYFSKVTRVNQDLYDQIYAGKIKRSEIQGLLDKAVPDAQKIVDDERKKLGLS
jgi:multiple sugar transport system substrate-binding protein